MLNTNNPLTPLLPESDVLSTKAPLELDEPPLTTDTPPPVAEEEIPADKISAPPAPQLPDPTVTYT